MRDANREKVVYPDIRKKSRAATVAAASRRIVSDSSYCSTISANLFYIPWGNEAEASAGQVDEEVGFIPPFGANTTIVSLNIVCEAAAGSTIVTIREYDETILASSVIDITAAETLFSIDFNHALADTAPVIIGIDPTVLAQSIRVQIVVQETT